MFSNISNIVGVMNKTQNTPASQTDRTTCKTIAEALQPTAGTTAGIRLPDGRTIDIPAPLADIIRQAASAFARGASLSLVESDRLLTTQEAADLMGVSRPTLIKLLDAEKIPYETIGRHRRIQADALEEYIRQRHDETLRRFAADAADTDPYETADNPLIRQQDSSRTKSPAARKGKQP